MLEEAVKLPPILPRTESGSKSDSLAKIHPNRELYYQVYKWIIDGSGNQEFFEVQPERWFVMIPFLLDLALRGFVSTSTLLLESGHGARARATSVSTEPDSVKVFLQAANMIARRVLLLDDLGPNNRLRLPPSESSVDQIQTFQTQHCRVYGGKHPNALDAPFHALAGLCRSGGQSQPAGDARRAPSRPLFTLRISHCHLPMHGGVAGDIFAQGSEKAFLEDFPTRRQSKELKLQLAYALRQIVNGADSGCCYRLASDIIIKGYF